MRTTPHRHTGPPRLVAAWLVAMLEAARRVLPPVVAPAPPVIARTCPAVFRAGGRHTLGGPATHAVSTVRPSRRPRTGWE